MVLGTRNWILLGVVTLGLYFLTVEWWSHERVAWLESACRRDRILYGPELKDARQRRQPCTPSEGDQDRDSILRKQWDCLVNVRFYKKCGRERSFWIVYWGMDSGSFWDSDLFGLYGSSAICEFDKELVFRSCVEWEATQSPDTESKLNSAHEEHQAEISKHIEKARARSRGAQSHAQSPPAAVAPQPMTWFHDQTDAVANQIRAQSICNSSCGDQMSCEACFLQEYQRLWCSEDARVEFGRPNAMDPESIEAVVDETMRKLGMNRDTTCALVRFREVTLESTNRLSSALDTFIHRFKTRIEKCEWAKWTSETCPSNPMTLPDPPKCLSFCLDPGLLGAAQEEGRIRPMESNLL